MPTMYPASPLRMERWRAGISLMLMSKALGHSVSLLSFVERGLLDRPEIEKAMRRYIAAQTTMR